MLFEQISPRRTIMATRSTPAAASTAPNYMGPFITVAILFGIFGFLTNLNSNLSPKLEDIFHLDHAWSNLVTSSWFLAYLIFSIPSAKVIEAVGYKRTMVISLFVMVLGALLFVPAARMANFPFFLAASFVLATGVTGLQTAANPYVTILGPEHSAPARLNLAQAFNSAGNILAPIVVGAFILTGSTKGMDPAAIAHTVQGPYIAVAIALLLLGFAVMMLHLPTITPAREFRPAQRGDSKLERSIWAHKHTVLAMVSLFLYVGLEVSFFANAIRFFQSQGVDDMHKATVLASFYPLTMMIGRFAGSFVMKYIKAEKLLASLGVLGVALMVTGMFVTGQTAVWCFIMCGLANSIMYPTIFALGIAELGPLTSKGSGVMTQACVGGAILPPLFGYMADKMGYQHAFLVPIVGYVFIIYFAISGYKPNSEAA
jgi:FHS family L-fucose permease-like MFS transporter